MKTLKNNIDKAISESDEEKASENMRKSFGSRIQLGKSNSKDVYAVSAAPGVLKHDGRSA